MDEIKSNKNTHLWLSSGSAFLMSIVAYIFFVYRNFVGLFIGAMDKLWSDIMLVYFLIALILSVWGLVIGIKRRKTVSRLSAIFGIIVPIIVILLTIFFALLVELSIFARTT